MEAIKPSTGTWLFFIIMFMLIVARFSSSPIDNATVLIVISSSLIGTAIIDYLGEIIELLKNKP